LTQFARLYKRVDVAGFKHEVSRYDWEAKIQATKFSFYISGKFFF